MIDGNIENGLERGFVKHRLNYVLIIDPKSLCRTCVASCSFPNIRVLNGRDSFGQSMNLGLSVWLRNQKFDKNTVAKGYN